MSLTPLAGSWLMRRWAKGTLIGFDGPIVVAALTGAMYQRLATRRGLARYPPPGRLRVRGRSDVALSISSGKCLPDQARLTEKEAAQGAVRER